MDSLEINLDKTESDRICELITGYVSKFKKIDSIDCIYYTAYQHTYNGMPGKPIIALTLVTTNVDDEILRSEVDNINNGEGVKYVDASKNIPVVIRISNAKNYKFEISNNEELRKVNKIYNSMILFDRHGIYSRLQRNEINKKLIDNSGIVNPNIVKIPKLSIVKMTH